MLLLVVVSLLNRRVSRNGVVLCAVSLLLSAVLLPLQGLSVASVALFGSLDTTEPAIAEISEQMADTLSLGGQSTEGSTYAPPVRQGPGGNSSLVLG